jgi:transposase
LVSAGAQEYLVVGVDTHLDSHTAVICDSGGRPLGERQVSAAAAGYGDLLAWARVQAAGTPLAWAIEGTGHYGLGLARHLAAAGEPVTEIGHTRHVGHRRAGKSDAIDALRAARELWPARIPPARAPAGTAKRYGC